MKGLIIKRILSVLFALIAIGAIVFLLFHTVSPSQAIDAIRALGWRSILVILFLLMLMSAIKSTRFFYILRFEHIQISWKHTFQLFLASQTFTPMPGGEVGRAMMFKKELNVHLNEVAGPVFLQALLELWTATLWVVIAGLFLGESWGWNVIWLFLLLVVLSAPLIFSKYVTRLLDTIASKWTRIAWIEKTRNMFSHFEKLIEVQDKREAIRFWTKAISLGLLAHAITGGLMGYIAYTQGVPLTFFQAVFAVSIGALIQGILTIIPGGLGVTEGGLIGVLSSFGINWQKAIIVTILYRLAMLPLLILITLFPLTYVYGRRVVKSYSSHPS